MATTKSSEEYAWIATNLNRLKITKPDGSVSFRFYDIDIYYPDLLMLLETHHQFPSDIPDVERRRIVAEAIRSTATEAEITGYSLKAHMLQSINAFSNKDTSDYVMITCLSMTYPRNLETLNFDQAEFVFSPSLPQNFARENLQRFQVIRPLTDLLPGSTMVRVKVSARSHFEAYHKAVDSLDFLRGIWNYRVNRGIESRWHSGPVKPVNEIRLGPVHTLHLPSGQEATSLFWYELLSPSESMVENVKEWDDIRNEEKNVSDIIDKSKYRDFLKNMFVRYARSLDSSDHESSFLKLWSLLEYVTAIKNRADYDELIRRTLFLSANDDYDKRILEHLRIHRNSTVHRGEASSHIETFIFQLKRYVERLMLFHLESGWQYSSAEELGQLLSKPRDPETLKSKITELEAELVLHRAALEARTPPPEAEPKSMSIAAGNPLS